MYHTPFKNALLICASFAAFSVLTSQNTFSMENPKGDIISENEKFLVKNGFLGKTVNALKKEKLDPSYNTIKIQIRDQNEEHLQKATEEQFKSFWTLLLSFQNELYKKSKLTNFDDKFVPCFLKPETFLTFKEENDIHDNTPKTIEILSNEYEFVVNIGATNTSETKENIKKTRKIIRNETLKDLVTFINEKKELKHKNIFENVNSEKLLSSNQSIKQEKSSLEKDIDKEIREQSMNYLFLSIYENSLLDKIVEDLNMLVNKSDTIIQQIRLLQNIHGQKNPKKNKLEQEKKINESYQRHLTNLKKAIEDRTNFQTKVRQETLDLLGILWAPQEGAFFSAIRNNIYQVFPIKDDKKDPNWSIGLSLTKHGIFSTMGYKLNITNHPRVTGLETTVNPFVTETHVKQAFDDFFENVLKDDSELQKIFFETNDNISNSNQSSQQPPKKDEKENDIDQNKIENQEDTAQEAHNNQSLQTPPTNETPTFDTEKKNEN